MNRIRSKIRSRSRNRSRNRTRSKNRSKSGSRRHSRDLTVSAVEDVTHSVAHLGLGGQEEQVVDTTV